MLHLLTRLFQRKPEPVIVLKPEPIGFRLEDLAHDDCRYPIVGENGSTYRFCGEPIHKKSYCEKHFKVCYPYSDKGKT